MPKYKYAQEKLSDGIYILATDKNEVRKRIYYAYLHGFHVLPSSMFPLELKEDWEWIRFQISKFGPLIDLNGNIVMDPVLNTMHKIRKNTGVKIAEKIYIVYLKLCEYNSMY